MNTNKEYNYFNMGICVSKSKIHSKNYTAPSATIKDLSLLNMLSSKCKQYTVTEDEFIFFQLLHKDLARRFSLSTINKEIFSDVFSLPVNII